MRERSGLGCRCGSIGANHRASCLDKSKTSLRLTNLRKEKTVRRTLVLKCRSGLRERGGWHGGPGLL